MDQNNKQLDLLTQLSQSIFSNLPDAIAYHKIVVDDKNTPIDYIFLDFNQKFEEFTGLKKENTLNRKVTEVIPGIKEAKPDLISIYGKVAQTGESTTVEIYSEQFKKWYSISVFCPKKKYFITIFSDISKRKEKEIIINKTARALQAISSCNQIIIHENNETELIKKICETIVKNAGYIMAWVGYGLDDEKKTVKNMGSAGEINGFLKKSITWADTTLGQRPIGIIIRTGEIFRSQNISTDELSPEWKTEALKHGYKSVLGLPIKINKINAGLVIFSNEPDAFNDEEVKLLTKLTEDLAFGIYTIRARAKKEETEKALKESEEKFSKAFNSSPMTITIADLKTGILIDANPTFEKLTGYSLTEAVGKTGKELNLYPNPQERERMVEEIRKNQKARDVDFVLRDKSGALHNVKVSSDIVKLGNADCILSTVADVTNEIESQKTLKNSEQQLKEAQRIAKIGNWDWNMKTDKITWSEEYYRIIGYDPNKPPPGYSEHLEIYTPKDQERLDAAVKKALQTGEAYTLDLEQIRPDGSRGWIIAHGEVKRDKDNNIIGLRGTAQDITERKVAEEAIRQAGVYNRNLIETSLDPMLTVNSEGNITDVNHAFELATGLAKDKLVGTKVNQYFTDPDKVTEGLRETMVKGFVRDYRVAIKNQSGNIIDTIWNTILYKNEKGEVQGIFAAARDITQLKKTEVALKEAEERYKNYIENSSDIVYAIDRDGLILYLSPQIKRFGYAPEELMSKQTIDYILLPEEKEEVMKKFKNIIETQNQGSLILRFKDKAGHLFWLEASGTVQKDLSGTPTGSIGVIRDITERKLAEDRLKELDSIKSRFIRVVSHQLRTPLSAIRWQLESLLNEPANLTELQKQMLHESYRADLDIISTINDLTTALDIEEGRAAHLDKTSNSLLSLWDSIEIDFAKKCQAKGITLEAKKPETPLPLIEMDTEKIRSVMEKLADNALTYTKEKGKITVDIEKTGNKLLFKISDTGIGIPKAEYDYIMQRFYRGSNATTIKPDAAGLGLYIAKNFIESHDGNLGFTSDEGKGSTFWFELPLTTE